MIVFEWQSFKPINFSLIRAKFLKEFTLPFRRLIALNPRPASKTPGIVKLIQPVHIRRLNPPFAPVTRRLKFGLQKDEFTIQFQPFPVIDQGLPQALGRHFAEA